MVFLFFTGHFDAALGLAVPVGDSAPVDAQVGVADAPEAQSVAGSGRRDADPVRLAGRHLAAVGPKPRHLSFVFF